MSGTPDGPPQRSPELGVYGEAGAGALADHLIRCCQVNAAVVQDGNADMLVARMLADGWVYEGVEHVAGKRVRHMRPPPGWTPPQVPSPGDMP